MPTISYPAQVTTTPPGMHYALCVPDIMMGPGIMTITRVFGTIEEVKARAANAVTHAIAENAMRSVPPPVPSTLETMRPFTPPTGCVEVERFMVTAQLPPGVPYDFRGVLPPEVALTSQDQFKKEVNAAIAEIVRKFSGSPAPTPRARL